MALKSLFLVCCYLPRWSCIFAFFCPAPSFSFSLLSLTHTLDSDPAVCVISFLASVSSLLKLPDGCLSAVEFRWFPGLKASPPSLFLFLLNLFQSASPSHTPAVSSTPASCSGNPTDAFLQLFSKQSVYCRIYWITFTSLWSVLLSELQLFYHWLISICEAQVFI